MRRYIVCSAPKCTGHSWLWEDKIQDGFTCKHCGSLWAKSIQHRGHQLKYPQKTFAVSKPRKPVKSSTYRDVLLEAPPGLGEGANKKFRNLKNAKEEKNVLSLVHEDWPKLSIGTQEKLSKAGYGPKVPAPEMDLKTILQQHLAVLPKELQEVVNKLVEPEKPTENQVTNKLKKQVGELRSLSDRRQSLQIQVDKAKETYGNLLKELQETQKAIDTTQEAVKTTSEEYKKFLEMQPTVHPEVEDADGGLTSHEHFVEVLNKVGLQITDDQKDQLAKLMTENDFKRRKIEKTCG